MRYRCILCGRDKFSHPQPHKCFMGYLKRFNRAARIRGLKSIWEVVREDEKYLEELPTNE